MKVAVTDANIFIDLINLKLASHFFELKIEVHTSFEVLDELYDHQREILMAYHGAKRLTIHNLSGEQLGEMQDYVNSNRLSDADKTVIYIAYKEKAMVLSSDGPARKIAKEKELETHGLVWLFDQLVNNKIISPSLGAEKITELFETNKRYSQDKRMSEELNKRFDKWKIH